MLRRVLWMALSVLATAPASAQELQTLDFSDGPDATPSSAPPTVAAQPQGAESDAVMLSDGTMIDGQLTELRFGQFALITTPTGEVRVIPWNSITAVWSHMLSSGAAPAAPALPPPATVSAPPTATGPVPLYAHQLLTPGPGRVPLQIESTGGSLQVGIAGPELLDREGRGHAPPALCSTPCVLYVPPGDFPLYTGGNEYRPYAREVNVPPSGRRVVVRASGRVRRGLSSAMIPAGAVLTVAGLLVSSSGSSHGSFDVGTVLTIAGVSALGGAMLLRITGRTGISEMSVPVTFGAGAAPINGGAMVSVGVTY